MSANLCNYCILNLMRRRYSLEGKVVTLKPDKLHGGVHYFIHKRGTKLPRKHSGWFCILSDRCTC